MRIVVFGATGRTGPMARALEVEPSLLGVSAHLLGVARRAG